MKLTKTKINTIEEFLQDPRTIKSFFQDRPRLFAQLCDTITDIDSNNEFTHTDMPLEKRLDEYDFFELEDLLKMVNKKLGNITQLSFDDTPKDNASLVANLLPSTSRYLTPEQIIEEIKPYIGIREN